MASLIDDPKKLNAFLSGFSPRSVSNAGRSIEMAAGSGSSGQSSSASSITAAAQLEALSRQKNFQNQFSVQPPNVVKQQHATRLAPSLDMLAIIDEQRLACELAQQDDAADGSRALALVRTAGQTSCAAPSPAADTTATAGDTASPPASEVARQSPRSAKVPISPRTQGLSATRLAHAHSGPSASFLAPERGGPADSSSATFGCHIPPVGHYRPKHCLTEHAVSGGYMEPKSHRQISPRHRSHAHLLASHRDDGSDAVEAASPTVKSVIPYSSTASLLSPQQSVRFRAREKVAASPPRVMQDPVFKSLSPKIAPPMKTDGADEVYWPRADPRDTNRSSPNRVDFSKLTPRKPFVEVSENPDAYYKPAPGIGSNLQQTADISLHTSRDHYPVEKKSFYQDADLPYDPHQALAAHRGQVVSTLMDKMTPRKPFVTPAADMSDLSANSNITDPSQKRVLKIIAFEKQAPHPSLPLSGAAGAPEIYDVNVSPTQTRQRSAVIHHSAPGHSDLHVPSCTDFGDVPNVSATKPNSIQDVRFEKQTKRSPMTLQLHDLQYDTDDTALAKRLTGNPMMGVALSREKRERAVAVRPAGAEVVYVCPVPQAPGTGAHLDFSRHVARDDQFCGRDKPSPRFLETHPRAPGPGAYDVK